MKRALIAVLLLAVAAFLPLAEASSAFVDPSRNVPVTGDLDPAPERLVLRNANWTCRSSFNYELVKITIDVSGPNVDATNWRGGCGGDSRIGRLEIDTTKQDGVKINRSDGGGPAPHDIVVQGGYIKSTALSPGAHQDCIQNVVGPGQTEIHFVNVICGTWGNAQFYVSGAGRVTFDNGVIMGRGATPVFIGGSARVTNTIVCQSARFGHSANVDGRQLRPERRPADLAWFTAHGNTFVSHNPGDTDPRSGREGSGTGNTRPECNPNTAGPPPPVLEVCQASELYLYLCWQQLQNAARFNFYVDETFVSHSVNPSLSRTRFRKLTGTHTYTVEVVYADGRSARSSETVTK